MRWQFDEHKKIYEHVNFHRRSQCYSERIETFVRNLCQIAERLDFDANKDEYIWGRMVISIADNEMPQKL